MKKFLIILSIVFSFSACQKNIFQTPTVTPTSLRDISAVRMNFRYEGDVPQPSAANQPRQIVERNQAVQVDFDQNRPEETVERMIVSPDKQRVLAVWQRFGDNQGELRLDMYSADGKLIRKITPNGLAVYYPDTIVWSSDGNNVAFMGKTRKGQQVSATPTPTPDAPITPDLSNETNANVDANTNANVDANANTNANVAQPTEQPKQVMTFQTEQIYICGKDGGDLKPLTQNQGLIYFYFVWSPDNSALVALVTTWKEWDIQYFQATQKGYTFIPIGRPRLIEKSGRERLLDDTPTNVFPVWSPDSSKIAVGYDKNVKIYDAIGDSPNQATVNMKNQLLLSSANYDEQLQKQETNANVNMPVNVPESTETKTLPDENKLVSFNPIVELVWTEDKMLYFQTAYVKEFKNSADNVRSNVRWHRLLFSPQPVALN
jgi:hypothetical protein